MLLIKQNNFSFKTRKKRLLICITTLNLFIFSWGRIFNQAGNELEAIGTSFLMIFPYTLCLGENEFIPKLTKLRPLVKRFNFLTRLCIKMCCCWTPVASSSPAWHSAGCVGGDTDYTLSGCELKTEIVVMIPTIPRNEKWSSRRPTTPASTARAAVAAATTTTTATPVEEGFNRIKKFFHIQFLPGDNPIKIILLLLFSRYYYIKK